MQSPPSEEIVAWLQAEVERLKSDPSSLIHPKIELANLIKFLPFVFQQQMLPSKNKYRGSGSTEIFVYHKDLGDRTLHKERLDFTGEKLLGDDVYFSYFINQNGSLVGRCFWHALNKPAMNGNKRPKNKNFNKDAPCLVVVQSQGPGIEEFMNQTDMRLNYLETESQTNATFRDSVIGLTQQVQQLQLIVSSPTIPPSSPTYPESAMQLVPSLSNQQSPPSTLVTTNNTPNLTEMIVDILSREYPTYLTARDIMHKIKQKYPAAKDLVQKPINQILYDSSKFGKMNEVPPKFQILTNF